MVRSATEIDKVIGSRLKSARRAAKLTQTELAKAISSSFQQIQKYERGQNRISSVALLSFAQMLQVPLLYFYEGLVPGVQLTGKKGTSEVEKDLAKFAKSTQGRELLRKYLALKTADQRQLVMELLDNLVR